MWHNSIHCEFSTQTHNITSLALLFRSTLLRSYHTSSFSIPLLAHLTVLYFLMSRLSARNAHPWPVADTKLNGSSRDDNRPAGAHSHSHQFISALIILCSIRIYIYRHIPGLLNQLREWKQTKKKKKGFQDLVALLAPPFALSAGPSHYRLFACAHSAHSGGV